MNSYSGVYCLYLYPHITDEETGPHSRNKLIKVIFKEKQGLNFIEEPILWLFFVTKAKFSE